MKANRSGNNEGRDQIEFDCPECGTHIVGEVSKCPKCGVEFVIEEIIEIECPNCGAAVPAELERCPKCNARLEISKEGAEKIETSAGGEAGATGTAIEEPPVGVEARAAEEKEIELRKQFPLLVEEVKSLLAMANEFNIEVNEAKRFIDKAVRAGKQRDVVSAVNFVQESLARAKSTIEEKIAREIEDLEKLAEVSSQIGSDPKAILQSLEVIKAKINTGDLRGALIEIENAKGVARQITGRYIEASEMCEALEKLIKNSEYLYVDVREARRLLNEARDAGKHGDWTMMGVLAKKGREELLKMLPDVLEEELKKSKETLLDAKAAGKDVSSLIKILKDGAVAFKRNDVEETLERLIEFKAEMKRLS
ncbi:MAG: zinc ribbon domain-containing protein [Methanomassiliicoccales archaeon]|nr:zinc ribbon domain-containing protein [Methanomassiliicoccales archaeon]